MGAIFDLAFLENLLVSMIRMATPLLLAGLGELYSEKAGMVNIGLDGLMTIGAGVGFIVGYLTGSPVSGLAAGALAGILLNLIYAFSTISLRSGQTINGMALNILAPALATFLSRTFFGVKTTLMKGPTIGNLSIPGLSKLPFIGSILFSAHPMTWFALLLTILTAWFFRRTKPGLNYLAVGEYPRAAESMGINVAGVKYLSCVICGCLGGLGGAYLTTCYIGAYSEGVVAGRGFIALSAVIFGNWSAAGVLLATLLFGLADAVQLRFQILFRDIPYQLLSMLPYLMTIFVLLLSSKQSNEPKANGQPYAREGK